VTAPKEESSSDDTSSDEEEEEEEDEEEAERKRVEQEMERRRKAAEAAMEWEKAQQEKLKVSGWFSRTRSRGSRVLKARFIRRPPLLPRL
jgi:hypothetical protein